MKVKVLLIVSTCILFSCNNRNQEKTKDDEVKEFIINEKTNSEKEIISYYIKEPSDSMYTGSVEEKYPNGIVKYKGFYRFGKRHGEWVYFYPNGNLWSESVYNRGKMNGQSKVYYSNGKLFYSAFYKNDKKDSIWTYYDSTGNETHQEIYKEDKLIKRIMKK